MRTALVVPTCRPAGLRAFLGAWRPFPWDDTVVVADLPGPVAGLPPAVRQFCWADLERHPAGELFSRQDSACRCFGFLQAVAGGADVVLTLDDDCFPPADAASWLRGHLANLAGAPAWASSVPGLRVRGLPYRGEGRPLRVGVSMGLWAGQADRDACSRLVQEAGPFAPPGGVRVMADCQLFPLCGMNFAFRREVLPAVYFPPMGRGSPYARFDDIWGGLAAQAALVPLGYRFTVGEPFVEHRGAGDVFEALRREAPGVAANEWVWRLFALLVPSETTVAGSVLDVAEALEASAENTPDPAYVRRWGESLRGWCRLAEEALAAADGRPATAKDLASRLGRPRRALADPEDQGTLVGSKPAAAGSPGNLAT